MGTRSPIATSVMKERSLNDHLFVVMLRAHAPLDANDLTALGREAAGPLPVSKLHIRRG